MFIQAGYTAATECAAKNWETMDDVPPIREGDLHIWRMAVDPALENRLVGNLSSSETERAERFRKPTSKTQFVVARGSLRHLLGKYLDLPPANIDILNAKDGKPGVGGSGGIKFNLSHSDQNLLIAVCLDREVGVDIERIDMGSIDDATLAHALHPNELSRFRSLHDTEKGEYFFDCWTRKEAYLKLLGCGFAFEPNEIELSELRPEKAHFIDLPPIPGYCSSAAVSSPAAGTWFYILSSNLLT